MTTTEEPTSTAPLWLDEQQQEAWRAYVTASRMVNRAVDRDLKEMFDMVSDDYGILVVLSESPARRRRFGDLAHELRFPKAHLTYRFQRLESQGLVERERCEDDGRGAYAHLTDRGYAVLVEAAPFHVASVRRHLFDFLDHDLVQQLQAAMSAVIDRRRAGVDLST
jgi:DNA-binding MarR family transcriptional regulator